MSDSTETIETLPQTKGLEGGSYEVIRQRLDSEAVELRQRLDRLNEERKSIFGAVETTLVATERVTTQHNCVPRDMVSIGHRFLFGYNVQLGLKSTTEPGDVFALYTYDRENHAFHHDESGDFLNDEGFKAEFAALYRYYKETRFVKFMLNGPHLYMAMRIGKSVEDIKTFKWRIPDDYGAPEYLGNRFDHEYGFPSQQEFEWRRAHRDMQRSGDHPHISIEDRLFVETIGGDLTIKIEDNTATGEGIYSESVTDLDQTLDDAEVLYAIVGNLILLKILPYQEKLYRYLVFNEKTQEVLRMDGIADSCVLLPDDHGLIFANGYLLMRGETKIFGNELNDMRFEKRIPSPNGEDVLHVFYNRLSGEYVLLSYNVIEQKVSTPILCNGYSVFPNGELVYFRTEEQPQKHHTLQIWNTPYRDGNTVDPEADTDSYLYKIGNAEIVRAMAECHETLALLAKDDNYADLYVDLAKKSRDLADSYFWLDRPEAHDLKKPLIRIHEAAQSAMDEFDKVQRLRLSTTETTTGVRDRARKLVHLVEHSAPDDILGFVHHLGDLRAIRGEIISLRELRYVDTSLVDQLEGEVEEATGEVSGKCAKFLLKPESLTPYQAQVKSLGTDAGKVKKVVDADAVEESISEAGGELEMLIEVVSNLDIADATETTQIIEDISTIYASLNQVRASLKNRRKELAKGEGAAQFGAQLKLLEQTVANYLDLCDTEKKAEEHLTRVMIHLEELEGRFSDCEEYIEQLTEKRESMYSAFEGRKQALVEKRNRRSQALGKSADRILAGIYHRLEALDDVNAINSYLASDMMIVKLRDVISELQELGESVKSDELRTRLKTMRGEAVRQMKDREELFVEGDDIMTLGNHHFRVNRQELELSMVPRDEGMAYHLAGTAFFEAVDDEGFLQTKPCWNQELISENDAVYRAEYLACKYLWFTVDKEPITGTTDEQTFLNQQEDQQLEAVQKFMSSRYGEGYTKGVHDMDTVRILRVLLPIHERLGLLTHHPDIRALALLSWTVWPDKEARNLLATKLAAFGDMRATFDVDELSDYSDELHEVISTFSASPVAPSVFRDLDDWKMERAATYLESHLVTGGDPCLSHEAWVLLKHFQSLLQGKRKKQRFAELQVELEDRPVARFEIARDWLMGCLATGDLPDGHRVADLQPYVNEAAAHLLFSSKPPPHASSNVESRQTVQKMSGSHRRIVSGDFSFDYHDFSERLEKFCAKDVPRFRAYQSLKTQLLENKRSTMRLEEFKPRVMSGFVRNKLLNDVYLPLIGDNLSKQIGTAGDETRTDRMGMLLLVSPPGYGKTTLMEYTANRLGLTFMKINGPAIGHNVTSLDPEDAPNASAREEMEKLNLSLEMGDNVMIYLDDIQHCNPEFLQKFISLCDAQRKIEGVYGGVAKTYDLRGRKVAVVMAGNPYTESGGRFQIPDMLANRADTYNLGDILGGHEAAFRASYIENSITSNAILNRLSSQSQSDVYAVMQLAETGTQEDIDLEGNYSADELADLANVVKKLYRVRDTILTVNLQYIESAAQEDAYRTEPSFKLQGSYRNMNRIAEKVLPLMTDEEVEALVLDHYENESQTLTTGAEANLLKFREMLGLLTSEEQDRWDAIRKTFKRNLLTGGDGASDPVSRVVGQLAGFGAGLENIEKALRDARDQYAAQAAGKSQEEAEPTVPPDYAVKLADATVKQLEQIIAGLRAVPVDVQINVLPVEKNQGAGKPELPVKVDSMVDQDGGSGNDESKL